MKKILILTLAVIFVASMSIFSFGCKKEAAPAEKVAEEVAPAEEEAAPAEEAAPTESKFEKKTPAKIGYSVYDMQQPYWQAYALGVQDAAEAAGYEFILSDQKSSAETQVSGSMDLIEQGISALIVSPVQPSALPGVVDAAHEAKIPVIIGDVGAEGDYDAFVLSANYEGGKLAALYMADQLKDISGTKEVLVILLHPGSAVGEVRAAGFIDEMANHPDFEIVGQLDGNDSVEGGLKVTNDTLAANPNLAGIYACNDPEAIGAAQALKTAGLNGVTDVLLVGFNGDPPALVLINDGEMAATIRQDPYGQGKNCVEMALTLLDGGTLTYDDVETRSVYFPVDVVTIDNVATFME